MQPTGMHGTKSDWRAKRDQEIDEFVAEAQKAHHAEPAPDLWDVGNPRQ